MEEVAISSTIKPPSRRPTNWRTIMWKKFSHCCKSSRGHNRFPNLGIRQREWVPPGNLTLKTSGFDYRTSIRLGNRLLEGTNKTLCAPGPRRKELWPHKRPSQTCLWGSRSLQQRHGLTVACHGVRGTEYKSPGILP